MGFIPARPSAALLCALVITISACTQSDQYLQFAAPVDVEGFIGLATGGERVWSREALSHRFGAPVAEQEQGQSTMLQYYGFALQMKADTLQAITLTDSRYTGTGGLRVGYSAAQLLRRWGRPLEQEVARWYYRTEGAMLVLTIEDEMVARAEWRLIEAGSGR